MDLGYEQLRRLLVQVIQVLLVERHELLIVEKQRATLARHTHYPVHVLAPFIKEVAVT